MFKIKDLNMYLADLLSDPDLFHLSHVNSKSLHTYNDNYFRKRFIKNYWDKNIRNNTYGVINLPEQFTKKEYYQAVWNLDNPEYIIKNDLDYLLNIMTNLLKNQDITTLIIRNDSVKCFQQISTRYQTSYYTKLAVEFGSSEIIKNLSKRRMLTYTDRNIFNALVYRVEEYLKLLPEQLLTQQKVSFILEQLSLETVFNKNICQDWTENYNPAFHLFVQKSGCNIANIDDFLGKHLGYNTVRLFTAYTSKTNDFYKKSL